MDHLKPVYFGNGESYSDDEDAYDFPTPEPSENGDEEEDDPTEDASSVLSSSSSSEDEEEEEEEDDEEDDDDSSSGSESEDETVDPAEADPVQFPVSIHICFPNDKGRCVHPTCENRHISSFFHICPYGIDRDSVCNRFGCKNFGKGFDQKDCPYFRTISQICKKPDCPYFGRKHTDVPVTPRYIPSKRPLENAVMPSAKKS